MLSKGKRICPYCGKPLALMGEVLGGDIHDEKFASKRVPKTVLYADTFEKDRLWTSGVKMFCSECGVNIELQRNPVERAGAVILSSVIAVLLICGFSLPYGNYAALPYALAAWGAVTAAMLTYAAVCCTRIKKYRSNFAFSTKDVLQIYDPELYHPISPNLRLTLRGDELHDKNAKKYLLSGNVFSAELAHSNAYLYLMSADVQNGAYDLEFRICGTRADAVKFAEYINDISDSSGFRLTLRFEGKVIGSAEVTEVYQNAE